MKGKRPKVCLHKVPSNQDCDRCTELIEAGKMEKRKLVSQQRLWQIERKVKGRCEICGKRKGKCPSQARCATCLNKDVRRHRKGVGHTVRPWVPGMGGRKRHIKGAEFNYGRALEAVERRAIAGVGRPGEV